MDEERRWQLRPATGPVGRAVNATLWTAIWVPLELLLLRWTAGAVATPFGVWPEKPGLPEGWLAVVVVTGFGVATTAWTVIGASVTASIFRARHGDVVVVDSRGIRTERLTRDGRRVVLDVAWRDVREARLRHGWNTVEILGAAGAVSLSPAGDVAQHVEIERFVNDRVAAMPGRPPVLAGQTAYLDDRGATVAETRVARRPVAVASGVGSALAAVNAVALALDGVLPAAVPLGAAAAGLATATALLLRWTPRWIARPGAVVLERRLGGGFAFEGRRLELVRHEGEQVTHSLVAVADHGRRRRRTILWSSPDAGPLEETGRWLARHAEIPFETRVERPDTS